MIDSHCHLDFAQFDSDRATILSNCAQAGISRILIPNTRLHSLDKLHELTASRCENAPILDMAAGLHPWFLAQHVDTELDQLAHWLQSHHRHCVAIGETGIDLTITERVAEQQQSIALEGQIALAREYKLPLILHHRNSHNQLIRLLKRSRFNQGGVIHAFSGSLQTAEQYLELGFLLGIGGTITYPRAKKTITALQHLPLTHCLLETDAPDMPMHGRQGQRNSPEYLVDVAAALAKIKNLSVAEVMAVTTDNYHRLFLTQTTP